MKKKITGIVLVMLLAITFVTTLMMQNSEVQALSKYGSRGQEVITIQTKLKRWGYYNGSVDGIYGSQTLAAVKWFQSKNSLQVDGIAGPKTLAAMGIFNSNTTSNSQTSNTTDLNLLARLVYAEARGESYTRTSCSCSSCFK